MAPHLTWLEGADRLTRPHMGTEHALSKLRLGLLHEVSRILYFFVWTFFAGLFLCQHWSG